MKKLFTLAVLTIFAFGFGGIASAAESARSSSPLSKVEPNMVKEEAPVAAPVATTETMAPQETAASTDESDITLDEAVDDLSAPAKEDEAPAASSDNE